MEQKTYLSNSDQETKNIAQILVRSLKTGTTICLYGSMAAGKTTFTQGVGEALNIPRIISPTYMIMREYPVDQHSFLKRLYHLDLYRLSSVDEIKAFALEEIWNQPENLVFIEWPETIASLLPPKRFDIHFKASGPTQREITIINYN